MTRVGALPWREGPRGPDEIPTNPRWFSVQEAHSRVASRNGVVDSNPARSISDQKQQDGRPGAVGGIGPGVDEKLDRQRHAEQGQRREARSEAQQNQHRKKMFRRRGHDSGDFGVHEREAVFLPKQKNRCVRQARPPQREAAAVDVDRLNPSCVPGSQFSPS